MKLTIDNKNYTLDINRAKELGILKEDVPPFKVGNVYVHRRRPDTLVMLCRPSPSTASLICIGSGNRWDSDNGHVFGVAWSDNGTIDKEDFERIGGDDFHPVPVEMEYRRKNVNKND